jgi:hypothetical protein
VGWKRYDGVGWVCVFVQRTVFVWLALAISAIGGQGSWVSGIWSAHSPHRGEERG